MGPRCGRTGRGKDGQGMVVRGDGREGEQEGSGGQGPVRRKERLQGCRGRGAGMGRRGAGGTSSGRTEARRGRGMGS